MVERRRPVAWRRLIQGFVCRSCSACGGGRVRRRALSDTFQLGAFEWLEEIVDRPSPERAGDDVNVIYCGEHDDWHAGMVGADLVEQAESVSAGHHDVGEDEVVVRVLWSRAAPLPRSLSSLRRSRCARAARLRLRERTLHRRLPGFVLVAWSFSFYRLVGRFCNRFSGKKCGGFEGGVLLNCWGF